RRLWLSGLLVAGGVLAASAVAFVVGQERATAKTCDGAEARLADVWDPARRDAVRAAFAATGLPYSDATWRAVSARIDDYAREWAARHREACRATRVEGRQSDTLMDLRMACLERRRAVLAGLTELWARGADGETLERAVFAADGLAPLSECADARALTERQPVPADRALPIAAARRISDSAQALALSRPRAGAVVAATARVAAEATGWPQVPAEAAMVEADVLYRLRGPGAARRALDAARLAGESRDDGLAARALILLARHFAEDHLNSARALLVADIAAGAVARAGQDPALHVQLVRGRAAAHRSAGQLDAAWTLLTAARAQAALLYGPASRENIEILGELAVAAEARGDYATARALTERNLAATTALLGAEHPLTAAQLNNLGMIAWDLGDLEASAEYHKRGLAISEKIHGPESLNVASELHNYAIVEMDRGELAQA